MRSGTYDFKILVLKFSILIFSEIIIKYMKITPQKQIMISTLTKK